VLKKTIVSLAFTLLSLPSFATVESVPKQKITNVRVEGSAGFIGFHTGFLGSSTCGGNRVWIDINDEIGRIKYSTALMAFASGKEVIIRADTSSVYLRYGACKLYDIYVTN
jgi:hypothetical protein